MFELVERAEPGPWRTVAGIVADFLTVRREYAPLIDLALGERAQRFLVRDPEMLAEALRQRTRPFSSRVSFLPLSPGSAAAEEKHQVRPSVRRSPRPTPCRKASWRLPSGWWAATTRCWPTCRAGCWGGR